jgi:hypothetical protein
MKARTLLAAISAALSLTIASCGKFSKTEPVTDLGFEVRTEVAFDADYLCSTLSLSLSQGTDGEYTFNYSVDGGATQKLSELGGSAVESGETVDLSAGNPLVLMLPKLSGTHKLTMEFTNGSAVRRDTVSFSAETAVAVQVYAWDSLDFTKVTLIGTAAKGSTYTAAFTLDGETLAGLKHLGVETGGEVEVDFAENSVWSFELPYILPGEHILKVTVSSEQGSETTSVTFTEPDRNPVQLDFAYNDITGELTLQSPYNPLPTAFDITVDITVKGSVTYRHKQFLGVADPQTETFTESGQAKASLTPGTAVTAIDGGLLKSLMDAIYNVTRTDACNAIGNGNARELHADINTVILKFTVASTGAAAGKTSVIIRPRTSETFKILYLYKEQSWNRGANSTATIIPTYTVNGKTASSVNRL